MAGGLKRNGLEEVGGLKRKVCLYVGMKKNGLEAIGDVKSMDSFFWWPEEEWT